MRPKRPECSKRSLRATVAAAGLLTVLSFAAANDANQPKPVQIGLAKTFLEGQPKSFIEIATDEFKDVMKKTTGLAGELNAKFAAAEVAEKLNAKQFDFGILHAHEFAWVQPKYPELRPLMIAATKNRVERAHLIVHKNSGFKTIADLRGKKLDVPFGTNEPCRMFLRKYCVDKDKNDFASFFGSVEKSPAQVDALDSVARNKVQATVVSTSWLEFYKEVRGAVFEKNLMVLQQSEPFPPAVIVYRQGGVGEATLKQFRDGLLKAHTVAEGREMMKSWSIDAFELTPKDYDKSLAEVLKAYPAP